MQVLLLLFTILSVSSTISGEKVKYNGYTVLRMQLNSTNYLDIKSITDQYNLDIWAKNSVEQWMDIMIPPNQEILKLIQRHTNKVSIADVEEHIQLIEQNAQVLSKKRQGFFDYFPTFAQILVWLDTQNALYPTRTLIFDVGRTYQGTMIKGIRISNGNGVQKKAIFFQAGIHAREWITVTTALYIIQQLLVTPPTVLNTFDFYIVPVFNVDGYIYTHTTDRLWRKNRQPVSGSSCFGTDLNRNYEYMWGGEGSSPNPCSETYRGPFSVSSPEVTAITGYVSSISTGVAFFLDIHSYAAMFMSPWSYTYAYPPSADFAVQSRLMTAAQDAIRGVNGNVYAIGSAANTIYIASGGSRDYTYGTLGIIPSFGVEIFGNSFIAPESDILRLGREIYAGVVAVAGGIINSN